jgi:hypothetical protein
MYRWCTATNRLEAGVAPGKTAGAIILQLSLILSRLDFSLREKRNRARRYATLDPALQTGQKGEFWGKKQRILSVSCQMTHLDMEYR